MLFYPQANSSVILSWQSCLSYLVKCRNRLHSNKTLACFSVDKKIGRREETYHELLSSLDALDAKEREIYGDAVLQVVTEANEVRIDKWKEEIAMTCEALERIMAPELKAQELKGKVLAYSDVGLSVKEIADKVTLSVEEVEKILADN